MCTTFHSNCNASEGVLTSFSCRNAYAAVLRPEVESTLGA